MLQKIAAAIILLFLPVYVIQVQAQSYPVNFTSLTSRDGLSSNTVNAILKDRYGWMWFATEDGLNRFDGNRFTVYRHIVNDSTSLPANDISSLYEDKSGNIWMVASGYVCLYNRKKDAFTNVGSYKGGGALTNGVIDIRGDDKGNIWTSGYNGLHKIDLAAQQVTRVPVAVANEDTLTDKPITCLFIDKHGRIWIGTEEGLFLHDSHTGLFHPLRHADTDANSLLHNHVRAIQQDGEGRIWVGTIGGLSRLLPDDRTFRHFPISDKNNKNSSNNIVYTIAADDINHRLWVGTEAGLILLDTKSETAVRIMPDIRYPYSLNRKSVRNIYIDPQGIYWVSTFQGGINKYDKNLNLFPSKQSNPFDNEGLSAPVVTSFAAAPGGNVYVGTDGGGLHLYHRNTGLFSRIPLLSVMEGASGGRSVLTLEAGSNGGVWAGTFANGLFYINPATGESRQFIKGSGPQHLNSNDIFCLHTDSKGNLWIGTNGDGVNVYHPQTNSFEVYRIDAGKGEKYLPLNGYIRAIVEDRLGRIWIASYGTGIGMLNPATGEWKTYNRQNSNLPADVVRTLCLDSSGRLWAGALGGGLSVLNERTQRFTSYAEKEGLANAMIYKIVEDKQGLLWASTSIGISSFDAHTGKFTNYTRYNGIQNNNFVIGAGIALPDGELFFGGLDGMNYFYPQHMKHNSNVPVVLLTDLRVANQLVFPSDKGPIQEHISIAREIHLDYRQNFSLSFAALDYTSPEQNTYAYKLEGFDKDWINAGTAKTASYTNIDPGDYVFYVKASNNDGVWNTKGASVIIHIRPPFWRTAYAYVLYFMMIVGLLLYSRYRTLQRLRKKFSAEQEKLLARQAMERERKEAEVARELDQLKIKFLTNVSHEFRTPISLIMGPVDNLLARPNDEKATGQLHMIKRNARRLLNLVNQLLDFRKMEEQELVLHTTPGDAVAFVKEVFDSFVDLSERKKIHYLFHSNTDSLPVLFDHDKLERILFNLLSNAFKFTPAGGTIRLEVTTAAPPDDAAGITLLYIRVADTGIGIPGDKKDKVFERFFQHKTSAAILNQGSGIGLSITREFVTMHGGAIAVESQPDKGTVFTIQLPLTTVDVTDAIQEKPAIPEEEDTAVTTSSLPPPAAIAADKTGKPVILLVEDNDDFRFYLKDNLKAYYQVAEAADGKEGWQKALALHPQLVVSDIHMPSMDGMQLSAKIKSDKRTSHIPVILLTALTGEEAQLKALGAGANDYLTKPFNFEILQARIHNLLVLNRTLQDTYTRQIKVLAPEVELESDHEKFLQKVLRYIEDHLNDSSLSVEQLSKHMGLSRSSLYSKILELTGQTPVEYIRSVKLEKAAVLLEKSEMNVAEVAYSTGFATPNYFAKAFKAKYQMLPSEYIQLKRG